jgi:hypothetical protein
VYPPETASIYAAALATELTVLRKNGLRRRKDNPSLTVLEAAARVLGEDGEGVNEQLKGVIAAGSSQMADVRGYAVRELLDAGDRRNQFLYQRRPHVADKLRITVKHLEETVEKELIQELARQIARLVAEQEEKEDNAQPAMTLMTATLSLTAARHWTTGRSGGPCSPRDSQGAD